MRPENPTVKRQELAMRTICALDSGLSAHTAIPLVSARRRITDTPRFLVKVALRIHIAAHDEQQVEQRKLLGARARRGHDAIVRRLTRLEPRVPASHASQVAYLLSPSGASHSTTSLPSVAEDNFSTKRYSTLLINARTICDESSPIRAPISKNDFCSIL